MSAFLIAVALDGMPFPPLADGLLGSAARAPECVGAGVTVVTVAGSVGGPVVIHGDRAATDVFAVGLIRLDSPSPVGNPHPHAESDLQRFARLVAGSEYPRYNDLRGEFAAVCWDPRRRRLMAVRDPLGARALYYRTIGDTVLIASRAGLLVNSLTVNLRFVADYLALGYGRLPNSVYQNVTALGPAEAVEWTGSAQSPRAVTYWQPRPRPEYAHLTFDEATEEFRRLFFASVRNRLAPVGKTWSQLSGGLDSSSIVATAEHLGVQGKGSALGGLVSYSDEFGNSDERMYQSAVSALCSARHHAIHCYRFWRDDGLLPPVVDQPTITYPMYARDRELLRLVTGAKGTVLLSGHGGDHVTEGSQNYLSDFLCTGRWIALAREGMRSAANRKTSFWRLISARAIAPIFPPRLRNRFSRRRGRHLQAIEPAFAKRYDLIDLDSRYFTEAGPIGAKWVTGLLAGVRDAVETVHRDICDETLDVRYPFLDPAVIELSVSLPPLFLMNGDGNRQLLRAAMRGLLPEVVRSRRNKGGFGPQFRWALANEPDVMAYLLRDPLLADLGCVNPRALARAVAAVRDGRSYQKFPLLSVLSLETWLRVRTGQWNIHSSRRLQVSSQHHMEVA
jgi:asparagine synthase (glutamine-hydrolysing)